MPTEPDEWNRRVLALRGPFLQSWEWGEFERALGRPVIRVGTDEFMAQAHVVVMPLKQRYVYAPRGPLVEGPATADVLARAAEALRTAASAYHPVFVRMELPDRENDTAKEALAGGGFLRGPELQPRVTRIVDLTKSDDELLADMEHDTRYAIRAAERRGVAVECYNTLIDKRQHFGEFWELFESTNDRHGLATHPKAYYENLMELVTTCSTDLFIARVDRKPIAAAITIRFGDESTYLYAASRAGYGKWNAPSRVLWEALRRARSQGSTTMDLWGADPEKAEWRGITAFKKSFGGTELRYLGTWDKPVSRLPFMLYRILKRIRGKI